MKPRKHISAILFFAFFLFAMTFAISAEADDSDFSINPNDSVDYKSSTGDGIIPDPEQVPSDSVASDALNPTAASSGDAQYNSYSRPEPIYKTPEAMAFQRYGDFSSGGADGSIDISIPIHTISCRDLQIPIALRYAGTGIKVADEASWVGLGWDLPVGGCINIVAAGQYDALVQKPWSDYLKLLDSKTTETFQLFVDHDEYSVIEDLRMGIGEVDFYSVSLPGQSFLFFINPNDDKPTVIGSEDGRYSITRCGVDGWSIRDVAGYAYEFSTLEYSLTGGMGMQISAIYLSSIQTPGGITATFNYERTAVKGVPQAYQWYEAQRHCVERAGNIYSVYGFPAYGSGSSFSNTEISKPWLESISTDNQTVSFELGTRTDYEGGRKIDRITVSDINGSTVNIHKFNYSTFGHSVVGGSCPEIMSHLVNSPTNGERLKLVSYSTLSDNQSDSISHTFTYHETHPLPLKTSAAIDFWGYYNGQENFTVNKEITDSRSMIPSLQDCIIGYTPSVAPHVTALAKPGACRFSDAEKMLSATLKSITYPTGGKTEFTFEPHVFRSSPVFPLRNKGYTDIHVSVEDINYPADSKNPGPVSNQKIAKLTNATGYLTVTFSASAGKKLRDLQQAEASVTLQPMAAPGYSKAFVTLDSCSGVNLDDTYYSTTFAIALDSVPYMLSANLPSQIQYREGSVKASLKIRDLNPSMESGGAGLRIAAIENYDRDGDRIGRREFRYQNPDGTTSGKSIINSRPITSRFKYLEHTFDPDPHGILKNAIQEKYAVISINSSLNSGPAITGAIARGTVAYERITEHESDGKGNLKSVTVRDYNVYTASEVLPDIHLLFRLGGGELACEKFLSASGDTLKTVSYKYDNKGRQVIKCNLMIEDRYYEYLQDLIKMDHPAPRYIISVYPYHIYYRVMSGIHTREFTPSGIRETTLSYSYNMANRLKSEECSETGSIGTKIIYKYSADYSTLPYTNMCKSDYFILGAPVETTTLEKRNGTYQEHNRVKFNYTFNPGRADMLRLSSWQKSVAGGTLTFMENFTYDNDGNLVGVLSDNTSKRAYLWSYGHTCPVAVIDGASYSDVVSWMGSQFISTLGAAKGSADGLLTQFRNTLKDKDVTLTSFTHKPLVGITSRTEPNGMKTTYNYDRFGRLSRTTDHNGNTLQTFAYDYRSAQGPTLTTRSMLNSSGTGYVQNLAIHDGLGRAVQTVQTGLNTTGKPVVAFSELDPSGNPVTQWLPFAVASGTNVTKSNVASLSASFHSDAYANSAMTYDALGRPTYAATSGEAWHNASRGVTTSYNTNSANSVRLYRADAGGTGVSQSGYWAARALSAQKTTDEDGLTMEVFTDGAGHTVLERRGGDNDTYYVYNNAGQLRYVLQPMYAEDQDLDRYAFEYRYDTKGNMVYKKIPGCEAETYTYDIGRRITFMQDGRLRERNLHRFYVYDNLGRTVIQGTAASCNLSESLNTATYTGGSSGFMSTGYTLQNATRIQQATLEIVNYYDDYAFAGSLDSRLQQASTVSARGMQTGSVIYNSDEGKSMAAIYYDIRRNVTSTREITDFGTLRVTENTYTFTNQPLTSSIIEKDVTILTENGYDSQSGLLISTDVTVNGTKQRVAKMTYDDLGRVKSVARGNGAGGGGTVSYSYNLHGHTTSISGPGFSQSLHYTDGPGKALYNGNVSSMLWKTGSDATQRGYRYTYNGYNWLTLAEYGEGASLSSNKNRYTERFQTFMRNGGIRRMWRYGLAADGDYDLVDDLHIQYDGNQISRIVEDADDVTQAGSMDYPGAIGGADFEYDVCGSLIKDGSRGIKSIEYDNHGNPIKISFKDGPYTKNVYSATGTKLKTIHSFLKSMIAKPDSLTVLSDYDLTALGTESSVPEQVPGGGVFEPVSYMDRIEYHGPVIYRNGKVDMVLFPGGYASVDKDNAVTFHYYTQDYLGNNRAVVNGSTGAIEQTTAYYPYGGVIPELSTGMNGQPYKFGGKELISENGINEYDFGARRYWSAAPQFTSVDPLSEKYKWLSPYLYCANNPVYFTDPTGEELVCEDLLAMENIRYTLEPIEASFVRFVNGKIDAELLNQCKSTSVNMTALQTVVNSETIFYVATASEYKRVNGEIKEMKSSDDEGGTVGVTMMPGLGGKDQSPDGDVHIFTSNLLPRLDQVENTAHELYGHAYFYELRKQGIDVNPLHVYQSEMMMGDFLEDVNCYDLISVKKDINYPLVRQINSASSQARNNYLIRHK